MIKEFRNGLFGLGLITGISLTLIFSAALDWPSPNSEEVSAPLANQVEGNLLAVEDLRAQLEKS